MDSIAIPQSFIETCAPLTTCVGPLIQALGIACPMTPCVVTDASEFAVLMRIGDVYITCVRHCVDPTHACFLTSIGTTLVPVKEKEKTPEYIGRIIELIISQLNWNLLLKLFERLPFFVSFEVAKEGSKFIVKILAPGLDATATIQEGAMIHCGIPLKPNGLSNLALMNQFLMLIPPEPEETFYVQLLSTKNGFAGLHNYQGQRGVLSLSNNHGISTKFVVKGIRLYDLEKFLKEPNFEMAIIQTKGTSFDGVIGHLEVSTATSAKIIVAGETFYIPTGQWAFLKTILEMF
jgi:hypothetical protein